VRWKGLIFISVIFVVFIILSFLLTDIWLENQIEEAGTALIGAQVEIDDLHFSLTELSLRWKRLQMTNPNNTMRNMIETGTTEFDLEILPLLSDKIIIEKIKLSELRTNTERETDGRIDADQQSDQGFIGRTITRLREEAAKTTSTNIGSVQKNVNIDSILKILDIESIGQITQLSTDLDHQYLDWQSRLAQLDFERDARLLEMRIKEIKPAEIKTIDGFQNALSQVNAVNSSIDSLQNLIKQTKANLTKDIKSARTRVANVDNWISADYLKAMNMARLPQLNMQNIGKLLFGKSIIDQLSQYLGYVDQARSYADKFNSEDPEDTHPPRLEGQDIYFYNQNARPDFWIKEILLSGETASGIRLEGAVQDIVSDQRQIGKTTEIRISGSDIQARNLALSGTLNYLDDQPQEQFNLLYSGFSLANTTISKSEFLPETIKTGNGTINVNLNLRGREIGGTIDFVADNVSFIRGTEQISSNKAVKILQSIIDGINYIEINAQIRGKEDDLQFSVNSNLDNLFIQRLQGIAGEEVKKAQAKIKAKIDQRVAEKKARLDTLVNEKEKQLTDQIEKYERLVREKVELTEAKKKEIQKNIDKEKSKVTDKLKKLNPFK
jgi:uncharacterized protein (TIGR03545 family)